MLVRKPGVTLSAAALVFVVACSPADEPQVEAAAPAPETAPTFSDAAVAIPDR